MMKITALSRVSTPAGLEEAGEVLAPKAAVPQGHLDILPRTARNTLGDVLLGPCRAQGTRKGSLLALALHWRKESHRWGPHEGSCWANGIAVRMGWEAHRVPRLLIPLHGWPDSTADQFGSLPLWDEKGSLRE